MPQVLPLQFPWEEAFFCINMPEVRTSYVRSSLRLSQAPMYVPTSSLLPMDDAPTPLEAWLRETGLARPIDLKFAFCSAQEVREACPTAAEAAAEAWLSVTEADAKLPSTWALWKQCKPGARGRPTTTLPAAPVTQGWAGLRSKRPRKDEGPVNDNACRRAAAKDALHEALSWKGRGPRQGVELSGAGQNRQLDESADHQDR